MKILSILLILIGCGTIYDEAIGDGPLPTLNNLKHFDSSLTKTASLNSTVKSTSTTSARQRWQALTASRTILTALSPQIAEWFYQLHTENRLVFRTPQYIHTLYNQPSTQPVLAAYQHINQTLYLGTDFWLLSDGQKAAVLVHEYRHFRQNAPKRLSHQLAQWISCRSLQVHSILEDEAMSYEQQAHVALGL